MKKTMLAAISATAILGLSACAEPEETVVEGDTVVEGEEAVDVDLPVVATEDADADGDRISISEDGVSADVTDGDTSIRADVDGDPSLEIETN